MVISLSSWVYGAEIIASPGWSQRLIRASRPLFSVMLGQHAQTLPVEFGIER
jgi:hypothetical protein